MFVDRSEALELLDKVLSEYNRSFNELSVRVGTNRVFELVGRSGDTYHARVEVFWDAFDHHRIRVIGSIDDGGWRAFYPLTRRIVVTKPRGFVRHRRATAPAVTATVPVRN